MLLDCLFRRPCFISFNFSLAFFFALHTHFTSIAFWPFESAPSVHVSIFKIAVISSSMTSCHFMLWTASSKPIVSQSTRIQKSIDHSAFQLLHIVLVNYLSVISLVICSSLNLGLVSVYEGLLVVIEVELDWGGAMSSCISYLASSTSLFCPSLIIRGKSYSSSRVSYLDESSSLYSISTSDDLFGGWIIDLVTFRSWIIANKEVSLLSSRMDVLRSSIWV